MDALLTVRTASPHRCSRAVFDFICREQLPAADAREGLDASWLKGHWNTSCAPPASPRGLGASWLKGQRSYGVAQSCTAHVLVASRLEGHRLRCCSGRSSWQVAAASATAFLGLEKRVGMLAVPRRSHQRCAAARTPPAPSAVQFPVAEKVRLNLNNVVPRRRQPDTRRRDSLTWPALSN